MPKQLKYFLIAISLAFAQIFLMFGPFIILMLFGGNKQISEVTHNFVPIFIIMMIFNTIIMYAAINIYMWYKKKKGW